MTNGKGTIYDEINWFIYVLSETEHVAKLSNAINKYELAGLLISQAEHFIHRLKQGGFS